MSAREKGKDACEFRYTDKEISWWVPDRFGQAEYKRARRELRKTEASRGNIQFALFVLLLATVTFVKNHGLEDLIIVCMVGLLLQFLLDWNFPSWVDHAVATSRSLSHVSWRRVKWWRLTSDTEFPDLGTLEAEYRTLGKNVTMRVGFDPTEVKEDILLAFLRRVAPDKELKAEGG